MGTLRKDLTNKTFNDWTVLSLDHRDKHKHAMWLCKCICGTKRCVNGTTLLNGTSSGCGCRKNKDFIKRVTKHKQSTTKKSLYTVWKGMRQRCNDKNNISYKNYGGRGIIVCARWNDYSNFEKDMGQRPTSKHQLDRIDNNKDYEPNNCRWVTASDNMLNSPHSKWWHLFGKIYPSAQEASSSLNIPVSTIYNLCSGKVKWAIGSCYKTSKYPERTN